MKDFPKLKVWHKAHGLVLNVYRATRQFPQDELYGLRSQVRCASVSIPSNIAEGCGRGGDAELRRFLLMAMGSASEVEYQLLLASELGYLARDGYVRLNESVVEVKRMLASLIDTLEE